MFSYIIGITLGLLTPIFQYLFNIYYFNLGVYYYSQVHTSVWNCYIHTLFMPLTSLGFLVAIPSYFKLSNYNSFYLQKILFSYYIGLYLPISSYVTLLYILIYYPILLLSKKLYIKYKDNINIFTYGLSLSIVSLFIQEYIGHYLGGDSPSRIEGVLNAIFYAKYYSIYHLQNLY